MPEPIITTGAALVGAGAWFADKVFGPSAESLGETLRVYLSDRVSKVFSRAEDLADGPNLLHQLPAGFLVKFVQAASFSEDDELITDLWANLLLNSSRDFSQKKVLYLDILEKLSAEDARVLDELIFSISDDTRYHSVQWLLENIRIRGFSVAQRILKERELSHFDVEEANEFNDEMLSLDVNWPVKILGSIVPYQLSAVEGAYLPASSSTGLANSNAPYDALIRQRLVQTCESNFISGFTIQLEGVMATALGVEFLRSCRGSVH